MAHTDTPVTRHILAAVDDIGRYLRQFKSEVDDLKLVAAELPDVTELADAQCSVGRLAQTLGRSLDTLETTWWTYDYNLAIYRELAGMSNELLAAANNYESTSKDLNRQSKVNKSSNTKTILIRYFMELVWMPCDLGLAGYELIMMASWLRDTVKSVDRLGTALGVK